MPDSLPPETLAWLRQTAKFEGAVTAQVLLHLLERVEVLDQWLTRGDFVQVPPTPEAAPLATDAELVDEWDAQSTVKDALRACYDLGREHGAAQPPAAQLARIVRGSDAVITAELEKEIELDKAAQPAPPSATALKPTRIITDRYQLGDSIRRAWLTHGQDSWCAIADCVIAELAEAQPAPPAAPAGGLVERVAYVIADPDAPVDLWHDDARAAIREVATWIRWELNGRSVADRLEQEAGR